MQMKFVLHVKRFLYAYPETTRLIFPQTSSLRLYFFNDFVEFNFLFTVIDDFPVCEQRNWPSTHP